MNDNFIPFNIPPFTGKEMDYIRVCVDNQKICGDGEFTARDNEWIEKKTGVTKALLTTSCTHATEMAAILCNIKEGDEVIMPSYTFVSTANAFVLRGATVVFVDIRPDTMNIDETKIEAAITPKTRAIVPVHYAGVSCEMDTIMDIAKRHNLIVIEDAAQAIDSYYKGRPLGSIGHMAAFSFHETKNLSCGEGGMITINDERFIRRSEIIWEKGTNRAEYYRGMVNKYGWCDLGSSFLPSEFNAAYLWAQIEEMDDIQDKRKQIWNTYYNIMNNSATFPKILYLPELPSYATNNAHIFYLICDSLNTRTRLMKYLQENDVQSTFHYIPLHSSAYAKEHFKEIPALPQSDKYGDCLIRLPLYYELSTKEATYIAKLICNFQ
jgi:dTDP-4-amino-4,6-dideoxygalactose transaminase